MDDERIINPELENTGEERLENSLRPKTLDEYIGQDKVKENMKIYIEAAKKRGDPLDHCLFYGPPGLGKTTIATIISNEEAANVMKDYTYDEMFTIEKDSNDNITMVKSNIVAINKITSSIATNIQKRINTEERENIEIALRKLYRI